MKHFGINYILTGYVAHTKSLSYHGMKRFSMNYILSLINEYAQHTTSAKIISALENVESI